MRNMILGCESLSSHPLSAGHPYERLGACIDTVRRCLLPAACGYQIPIANRYLTKHATEVGAGSVDPSLLLNQPVAGLCEGEGGQQGAVDWVAARTEGFSGSDLMELCSQVIKRRGWGS